MIKYNSDNDTMYITFYRSKDLARGRTEIEIQLRDVEEMSWFTQNGIDIGIDVDLDNFLSLRVDVDVKLKRSKGEVVKRSRQLSIEFEEDQHLVDLVDAATDNNVGCKVFAAPPDDVQILAEALILDSENKYKLRSRGTPHKKDAFISNKKSDEILLVYPFGGDKKKIDAATEGLNELSCRGISGSEDQDTLQPKNSDESHSGLTTTGNNSEEKDLTTTQGNQRSHHIVIRVEDYEKLDTGQWLNDSLVDLWMQWISRNINCRQSSNVHFFTSHFYSTLASEGVMGVKSWTARKNINIFEKKLIFIPINKTLHWSLCVIVNPGTIRPSVDDDEKDRPLPCMLFFDSLNMHRKVRVQKDLMKWLNSEWKSIKDPNEDPFNKASCKIYDPQGTYSMDHN